MDNSDMHNRATSSDDSTAELITRAGEQISDLVRQEFQLARAEMSDKGRRLGLAGGLFGGGALAALFGIQALVAAAVAGLATVLALWASALIVGGVLLVAAAVVAWAGKRQATEAAPLVPEQTVQAVKADLAEIKQEAHR